MREVNRFKLAASLLAIGLFVLVGPMLEGRNSTVNAEDFAGEIVIGYDVGMTGPYSATCFVMYEAGEDYWKQNNYKIWVDGKAYKIKFINVDNKGDVSLTVSNFNRFVGDGAAIVRTEWTPGGVNLMPLAEKAKVPVVVGGYTKGLFVPPSDYIYLNQPSYPGTLCAAVKWYKENVWKGPGKMKLGLLLWDSAFGRSSHIDATYDYLKQDLGVEVLPTLFVPVRVKDFTPQLSRLKSQGVNLIYMQALAGQYAILAKDAKRLNVTPGADLMSTFWCMCDKYLDLAGDAAEGTYGPWHWNIGAESDSVLNPVVMKLHDCMEKYRGNRYYDVNYFQGWMGQYINHYALEMTIKKYGFPITGEQVANSLSNMPKWDWGLTRSFSGYGGGDRLGWHEIRVFQVKKGKIVGVSDWVPEPEGFLKRAPWIIGK
jgi:ABC-type branched-subunit amino acid transport system substrate-binding protein